MPQRYPAPRGTVLLLSCMDLRLLDDTVRFMDRDNLTNRYDQFILAGAALGAAMNAHWNEAFFEHLDVAIKLHQVNDVYILEHRHCGAYQVFLGDEGDFDDSAAAQEAEAKRHAHYAHQLAAKIEAWARQHGRRLQVRCFLMDLRGEVELLERAL
jgi:carbonic anhydrase